MMMKKLATAVASICLTVTGIAQTYHMPAEDLPHEGTWLQWPHNELYGPYYQDDVEAGWVTMTNALQSGENVHIIALNNAHRNHITSLLTNAGVPLTNVDFFIYPTDDVWVRDNGPVFVYDANDNLTILDWGFNGWGGDTPYGNCDDIPASVSADLGIPRIDLSAMVLEGGAVEHDGHGTMIATRSCIVHSSRNPGLTETEIENYMTTYLGFTKFIWLDGVYGQDITDHHVDGFLKFANDSTIITMDSTDLDYWLLAPYEISTIYNATNVNNEPYDIVTVPLTQNTVKTTWGNDLNLKGSYCNYYIGNEVILVPVYGDPNDQVALNIIQGVHPNRTVVGVNVQNLYEYGGMTHCVTQQQPVDLSVSATPTYDQLALEMNLFPNPVSADGFVNLEVSGDYRGTAQIKVCNTLGQVVMERRVSIMPGAQTFVLNVNDLPAGIYYLTLNGQNSVLGSRHLVLE